MAVERTAISPLYDFLAEPGETASVSLSDRPSGEDTDMVVATFTNRSKNAVRIGVVRLPLKKMPDPKVSRMAALDVLSSL